MRRAGAVPYLRPDGKTQVSVVYEDGMPVRIDTVLISTQHAGGIDLEEQLRPDLIEHVINPLLPTDLDTEGLRIFVNPTGIFELGGPHADTGLTGRKIIVDTYGGMARHGGGAFSGKDPSKVDRSAAYAARWVAKHVVASGAAKRCEIQVAYAIGVAHPVSLMVETFGTETVDPEKIAEAVERALRPAPGCHRRAISTCAAPSTRRRRPTATSAAPRRSSPGRPPRGSTTCGPPSDSDSQAALAREQPQRDGRIHGIRPAMTAPRRSCACARNWPRCPKRSTTRSRARGRTTVTVGTRVRVPLHGRSVRGRVVDDAVSDGGGRRGAAPEVLAGLGSPAGRG